MDPLESLCGRIPGQANSTDLSIFYLSAWSYFRLGFLLPILLPAVLFSRPISWQASRLVETLHLKTPFPPGYASFLNLFCLPITKLDPGGVFAW